MAADIDNTDIVYAQSGSGGTPSLFSGLFEMQPFQFAVLAVVVGLALAEPLDIDEQNSLGNFLSVVGQTMTAVAGQGQFLLDKAEDGAKSDGKSDGSNLLGQLTEIRKRLSELEDRLNENRRM